MADFRISPELAERAFSSPRFEVLGKSGVVVFDPRKATVARAGPGAVTAATNVKLSVLREGMFYSLK